MKKQMIMLLLTLFTLSGICQQPMETQASWYGEKYDGRTTASGEIYDMDSFTTASPNIPFGTVLLVTNLENKRSVVVKVNDRGPFEMDTEGNTIFPLKPHPKRGLDLSKRAFRSIAEEEKGIIDIEYRIIQYPNSETTTF